MANNFTTTVPEQQWSYAQKAAVAITPKISSSLSIFGSSYIIYHSLSKISKRHDRVQIVRDRILIMLSFCDLFTSFGKFVSTWAIPKDMGQDFVVFNVGNQATCNAQGFIMQFGAIGAALYNMSLSVYFYMCVRNNSKSGTVKTMKIIEPIFHTISIGFPLSAAMFELIGGYFNTIAFACFISEYPQGCVGDECIRGENAHKIRIFGMVLPLVTCIVVITVSMILLYKVVKRQEQAISAYTRRWSVGVGPSTLRTQRVNPPLQLTRSHKVYGQAKLYIGAFLVTWLPLIFHLVITKKLIDDPLGIFYSSIFALTFAPLQGLFNMLVYMRYNPVQKLLAMIRLSATRISKMSWTCKNSSSIISDVNGSELE